MYAESRKAVRDGLICKTEMEMQTLRANMNTKREGWGELGDWC